MNEGNLIPVRSEEEARAKGRAGGKKSGEARRRKRDQRQLMEAMLKAVPELDKAAIENLKRLGFKGKGENKDQFTIEAIGMAALLQKVMRGDTRAYRLMLEILGEDAFSRREEERIEHENALMNRVVEANVGGDGLLEALGVSAKEVFADGMDEPKNLND